MATIDGKSISIAQNSAKTIKFYKHECGYYLLTLEELLEIFSKRKNKNQKLCIDIKDYGFEEEHIHLVKKYKVENNIIWISWIPQTLIKIDKLMPKSPKILSYVDIRKYPFLYWFAKIFSVLKIPLSPYVLIGQDSFDVPIKYSIGYQHAYISYDLPHELLKILRKSGGGICIYKKLLSKKIIQFKNKEKLLLCVFSVNTFKDFLKYAKKPIDIIFVDSLKPMNYINNAKN